MDSGRTVPADVARDLLDELLASKRLVETIALLVAEGVVHVDERRRIVRFNAAAERMLGCAAVSVIGAPFDPLLHETNTKDPFADGHSEVRRLDLWLRDSQGAPLRVHAACAELRADDAREGWLLAFRPERRIDEIEQLKNELVSTVSHELKTPLAAIKAYTATLRENPALYETHRQEFLGVVEQQADRLSRLVDDMLLVTRVETDQLLRRRSIVPVERILDAALGEVARDPVLHPVERDLEQARVSGDPDRLRDIFRNLIENAVKYSPEGGQITVRAREGGGYTTVEVRDRGTGIAEEHLPYIFDRFYRVDADSASSAGGSGLGLYIVNALVRAHGGAIDVRSAPGEGTAFTLRLPLR